MIEVLIEKGLKVSLKNGSLAVSPKNLITGEVRNFIRQNKPELIAELRRQKLETLFSTNPEMKEQFEFEVLERIAIMTLDGKVLEIEAIRLANETTFNLWISLFGD